ncbi:hypothetical protein Egran_02184 [Elaphomyces granulatus]|uniref:Uncharacterized protein n=1 Tax=Elaphomyces granulatus TaxID=519963 RepID=A0A232M115_9EURO|nr:hypothetical protein Egran_02184 [Elaphomyces granulatus]
MLRCQNIYMGQRYCWKPRQKFHKGIGRLVFIGPSAGDLFYPCLLLTRSRRFAVISDKPYRSFREVYQLPLLMRRSCLWDNLRVSQTNYQYEAVESEFD